MLLFVIIMLTHKRLINIFGMTKAGRPPVILISQKATHPLTQQKLALFMLWGNK